MVEDATLAAARAGDPRAFEELVARFRRELRAYCYRMSGSLDDADDLLQESLLRAWRGLPSFEGRASVRTWLYRVTWSTCVDALEKRRAQRRAMDLGPAIKPGDPFPAPEPGDWIGPAPAEVVDAAAPSPEARYDARESVSFAFLAALQLLPAKQRAILLLRDVLGWSAEECAEAFESSVASVNSALQRARATLDARAASWQGAPATEDVREQLARYVAAWESADVKSLEALLHRDATLAMPPFPAWLQGASDIAAAIGAMVLPPGSAGVFRFVGTQANGLPAVAAYKRGADGAYHPEALHVLTVRGDKLAAIDAFLFPALFPKFGLPERL